MLSGLAILLALCMITPHEGDSLPTKSDSDSRGSDLAEGGDEESHLSDASDNTIVLSDFSEFDFSDPVYDGASVPFVPGPDIVTSENEKEAIREQPRPLPPIPGRPTVPQLVKTPLQTGRMSMSLMDQLKRLKRRVPTEGERSGVPVRQQSSRPLPVRVPRINPSTLR